MKYAFKFKKQRIQCEKLLQILYYQNESYAGKKALYITWLVLLFLA